MTWNAREIRCGQRAKNIKKRPSDRIDKLQAGRQLHQQAPQFGLEIVIRIKEWEQLIFRITQPMLVRDGARKLGGKPKRSRHTVAPARIRRRAVDKTMN